MVCLVVISALVWIFVPNREPEYLGYLPHNAVGIVIIRALPESLQTFRNTRLKEWIQLGDHQEEASPWAGKYNKAREIFQDNIREMVICLHRVVIKNNGALKPEVTIFIQPRPGRAEILADKINSFVLSIVGGELPGDKADEVTAAARIESREKIFHLEIFPGYLAASNSEQSWEQFLALRKKSREKILMPPWYPEAKKSGKADIFVYCRGFSGLIPGFIYTIEQDESGPRDHYREF